jgi:peptidyl-prolyl cis-trans isomerase SurA
MAAIRYGQKFKSEKEMQDFRDEVLNSMISDQLFLIAAKADTLISVRPDEVDRALDDHITRISGQYENNDAFLAALAQEGLTLRELRKKLRPEVKNQLLKQRVMQRKLSSISVSRHEVEEFYNNFQDSIPTQPEAAKLAHILLTVDPAPEVEDSVKQLAQELRQKILDGADFATISARYSSMGAGENGGDLGYVSREDVVPEFARAAFNLSVGDISGVIKTQFGYHIIKCEGVKKDQLKLRHVLLAVQATHEDTVRTARLADSLVTEIRNGADFAELAKQFSSDDNTRAQGGELGWFDVSKLPPEFAAEVKGWHEVGQVRGPVYAQTGLHILKLLDYTAEKHLTLANDYDRVKEMARQQKLAEYTDKWVAEIKKDTYIDIRLDNM